VKADNSTVSATLVTGGKVKIGKAMPVTGRGGL
jgi:hypothetical protein